MLFRGIIVCEALHFHKGEVEDACCVIGRDAVPVGGGGGVGGSSRKFKESQCLPVQRQKVQRTASNFANCTSMGRLIFFLECLIVRTEALDPSKRQYLLNQRHSGTSQKPRTAVDVYCGIIRNTQSPILCGQSAELWLLKASRKDTDAFKPLIGSGNQFL